MCNPYNSALFLEGGCFISYPSTLNDKKYDHVRSFDDCEVLEIPHSLIIWLLKGVNIENKPNHKYNVEMKMEITGEEIKILYINKRKNITIIIQTGLFY